MFSFKLFVLLSLLSAGLCVCNEEQDIRNIYSHFQIGDYDSALTEAKHAYQRYPESEKIQEARISALAYAGNDDEAIHLFKQDHKCQENFKLIETLSWAILQKSKDSLQQDVNATALMAAFLTHDVRAVEFILEQMSSSNAYLRALSIQLATQYRDQVLVEKLKRLLVEEKVWFVRLEVLKALGIMEVKESKEPLKKILTSPRSTAEEKGAAISSLVSIYDGIEDDELGQMLTSKRAGLRQFACHIVSHLDLKKHVFKIQTLLDDACSDVRVAALDTFALMGLEDLSLPVLEKIQMLMEDPSPVVSITAAWLSTRFIPDLATEFLKRKIFSEDDNTRRLAAFALANSGKVGLRFIKEALHLSPDPYVRMNLALGMLGHIDDNQFICEALYSFLMTNHSKVMWSSLGNPLFQILAPTNVIHVPQISRFPTMVDQLTRLEVLNRLAILDFEKAKEVLTNFLNNNIIGVTYAASTTLLREGGEAAVTTLTNLLHVDAANVRVQAALVLALSGESSIAVEVLQGCYHAVDREMKLEILHALGQIGDKKSIPFLIDLLAQSHQILKAIAASALIQCVYH